MIVVCKNVSTPAGVTRLALVVNENTLNNAKDEQGEDYAGVLPFSWTDAHGQSAGVIGSVATRVALAGEHSEGLNVAQECGGDGSAGDACPQLLGDQPVGFECSKAPTSVPANGEQANCIQGYRSRSGTTTSYYSFDAVTQTWTVERTVTTWSAGENPDGWSNWQALTEAQIERFELDCGGGQTPTKSPESFTQFEERKSCAQGVQTRSRSVTTSFAWNASRGAFDGTVTHGDWTNWTPTRGLSSVEFEQLGCRPDQPGPAEVLGSETRMNCVGLQQRSSSQVTTFVWNASKREYDTVVGETVWSDWTTVRKLTTAELEAEGCVLGEETLIPTPKPDQKPTKSVGEPTVKGVERVAPPASVPTAVAAGSSAASPSAMTSVLAQLLVGGGMLLLVAGGWIGLGRREAGAHKA